LLQTVRQLLLWVRQQEWRWGRLVVQSAPMGLLWHLKEQACRQQVRTKQHLGLL
jgi:hypothetical protein